MSRRFTLPILSLLALALAGAGCESQPLTVTVIGDSHSDVDRVPRYDWLQWAPSNWVINEHATRGDHCRHTVLEALEEPEALAGDVMVVFCGTNDAGYDYGEGDGWDVAVPIAWIQMAIDQGLGQGDPVVVVAPPHTISDMQVPAAVRNARLAELRDAIYALQATYDIEVADVWGAILAQPIQGAMFAEDGLHLAAGGQVVAYGEINDAIARARAD